MAAAPHNPFMGIQIRRAPLQIRKWRNSKGLTQEQLVERLPIDYTAASLSRLENGKLAYTQEVVEALARAFQCAPYELFHTPQDAELWRKFNALLPRQRSAALVLIEVAFSQHNSPT